MDIKYRILLVMIASLIALTGCGGYSMRPEKALSNFAKAIENGKIGELSLTIYHLDASIFTLAPLRVNDLITHIMVRKIDVDGTRLIEHSDLLKQLCSVTLVPVKQVSYTDARVYYVVKDRNGRKIFDVALWRVYEGTQLDNGSIFVFSALVNRVEFEDNNIFYDAIIPFLPEDTIFYYCQASCNE
ncbi:MAG: hypothetical protein FWF18_01045 [Dehalococcoidia bacterium]|nr:hypothetical protein [Dehalococcoidia bacterium]